MKKVLLTMYLVGLFVVVQGCKEEIPITWIDGGTIISSHIIQGNWSESTKTEIITTTSTFVVWGAVSTIHGSRVRVCSNFRSIKIERNGGWWRCRLCH